MGLLQDLMATMKVTIVVLYLLIQARTALALWPSRLQVKEPTSSILDQRSGTGATRLSEFSPAHQQSAYDIVLQELRQLESEPLCHRVAARLLVNNCELLEGKDEATVLTDSGRQVRDFVDSYAASLAICDLERGSFLIPEECAKFREPILGQLPFSNKAHLHVTSGEIDACLAGLGASDSAWNTWVSYRHKALRFCDAARADNDKAQHILLFRRLAKIMNQMADSVDQELEIRTREFDKRAQAATNKVDNLSPTVERLSRGLRDIEFTLSNRLASVLEKSTEAVNGGLNSAVNLQKLLEVMTREILSSHAEVASAHEQSLQVMSGRAESEMGVVMAVVAAAATSATSLQDQIEISRHQAAELEHKQANLEHGLQRLINITDDLSSRYDDQTQLLYEAQNLTNGILEALEDTAASASIIGEAFSSRNSATSWWPYIWCPAASLVMGSYGLPPSALRNLGLLALGEIAGFIVSRVNSISFDVSSKTILTYFTLFLSTGDSFNNSETAEQYDMFYQTGISEAGP